MKLDIDVKEDIIDRISSEMNKKRSKVANNNLDLEGSRNYQNTVMEENKILIRQLKSLSDTLEYITKQI